MGISSPLPNHDLGPITCFRLFFLQMGKLRLGWVRSLCPRSVQVPGMAEPGLSSGGSLARTTELACQAANRVQGRWMCDVMKWSPKACPHPSSCLGTAACLTLTSSSVVPASFPPAQQLAWGHLHLQPPDLPPPPVHCASCLPTGTGSGGGRGAGLCCLSWFEL